MSDNYPHFAADICGEDAAAEELYRVRKANWYNRLRKYPESEIMGSIMSVFTQYMHANRPPNPAEFEQVLLSRRAKPFGMIEKKLSLDEERQILQETKKAIEHFEKILGEYDLSTCLQYVKGLLNVKNNAVMEENNSKLTALEIREQYINSQDVI